MCIRDSPWTVQSSVEEGLKYLNKINTQVEIRKKFKKFSIHVIILMLSKNQTNIQFPRQKKFKKNIMQQEISLLELERGITLF